MFANKIPFIISLSPIIDLAHKKHLAYERQL